MTSISLEDNPWGGKKKTKKEVLPNGGNFAHKKKKEKRKRAPFRGTGWSPKDELGGGRCEEYLNHRNFTQSHFQRGGGGQNS